MTPMHPAMASALPPGWSEAVDENGRTYYQNAATQATQWGPPAWPTSSTALPPGWSEAVDENGRTYYQNAATQATQWGPPAWPTSSTALPPGWSEAVDSSREWQLSREDRDRKRKDPLLAAALVSDL